MIKEELKSPWSDEQVANLQKWQDTGWVHPFTCGGEHCNRSARKDQGVLIPANEGWACPCGKYKQNWAHEYILRGEIPEDPAIWIQRKIAEQRQGRDGN